MDLNSVRPSTPNMVVYDEEEDAAEAGGGAKVNNTVLSTAGTRYLSWFQSSFKAVHVL